MTASQLIESKRWKEGAEFLKDDEPTWPERLPNNKVLDGTEECIQKVDQFAKNCQIAAEVRKKDVLLGPDEYEKAEVWCLKNMQEKAFPGGEKDKSLIKLNPKKDEAGVFRVNGRLKFANDLPYNARYPILLAKDHPTTKLIIVDAHEKLGHGTGVEHLLTELRSRYWIIKGRRAVRNVIERCQECLRKFNAKPDSQRWLLWHK